ncbi:MAG: hypothetical protein P4L99_04025 [Chthoniobacter sp.]|nr:hypothetical protein [Chthoniobacter sp.]
MMAAMENAAMTVVLRLQSLDREIQERPDGFPGLSFAFAVANASLSKSFTAASCFEAATFPHLSCCLAAFRNDESDFSCQWR